MPLKSNKANDIGWLDNGYPNLALHHSWVYEAEANIRDGMSIYADIIAQAVPVCAYVAFYLLSY